MSDVTDWSGVSSPPARLAYQGSYTPGTSPPITVNLNQADRSLVVLAHPLFNSDSLGCTGVQSGVAYSLGAGNDRPAEWGWAAPAYGAADQQVTVSISGNTAARTVTIIAVPDEITYGPPSSPAASRLVDVAGAITGISGNPLYVTESGSSIVQGLATTSINFTSTGAFTLVPTPPVGRVRIVDYVIHNSTGTVFMAGLLLPANVVVSPKFPLNNGQTLVIQSGAANGSAWAGYHDIQN